MPAPDNPSIHERLKRNRQLRAAASPRDHAKRRFAAAVREILDSLEASGASARFFDSETPRFVALAEELRAQPAEALEAKIEGYTGMENFHERSPIVGLSNPLAPPAEIELVPEEKAARGRVEFGKAFEGGPGLVHGGFLAALLDEALGMVTIYSGTSGMTGEYTIRYHAPTRIKVPLHFEARFDHREGRKLHVSADLWDGETRTVSAKGLFIAVDAAKFEGFHEARRERIGER